MPLNSITEKEVTLVYDMQRFISRQCEVLTGAVEFNWKIAMLSPKKEV